MANKFGVPSAATLFIYDHTNTYTSLTISCSMNPVYGKYCFDPSIHEDGDVVTMIVHGYRTLFPNDVRLLFNFSLIIYYTYCHKQLLLY